MRKSGRGLTHGLQGRSAGAGGGGGGAPSANTCEEEAALRSQRDTPHLVLLGAHGAAKSLKIRPVHMT